MNLFLRLGDDQSVGHFRNIRQEKGRLREIRSRKGSQELLQTITLIHLTALRIGFNPVTYTVSEEAGPVTLTVEVLEGQPGPGTIVFVSYRLLDDTALGEDGC